MNEPNKAEETLASLPSRPAQRLLDLWARGSPPALEEFLAAAGPLGRDDLVAVLRADQAERWQRGERRPAEAYLALPEVAAAGTDVALDVIFSEVILRQDLNETPTVAEYIRRFPAFERSLRLLFSADKAVDSWVRGETTIERAGSTAPVRAPSALPEKVGNYRIVMPLDAGGQAAVYRAVHSGLGKDVVLKLSHEPILAGEAAQDHLAAEGRILADLDHPNLARVYDLGTHEGRLFLVMEYVRGRTLEQHAAQARLAPREAAALVAKVARALAVAHGRGVTHGDVKPRNILIEESGQPRLIDFGMARLRHAYAEDAVPSGTISGTVAYMAPEQARGDNDRVNACSDVFALGGVLYFLLTGKPPYQGNGMLATLERAARCDWDREALRLSAVPRRLANVCARAMAADSAERYRTAEEMAAELEALARPSRRRVVLAASLAGALLGLGLLIFLWTRSGNGVEPPGDGRGAGPGQGVVPADQPFSLSVRIWREEEGPFDLLNAVPLRTGDEVVIRAEVPPGLHAALLLLSSEGKLEPLLQRGPGEALRFPVQKGKTVPVKGRTGTEVLLLCARASGPATVDEIRKLWGAAGPWPVLPKPAVVRMDRAKVYPPTVRGFGAPKDRRDPVEEVEQRLEELRVRLRERFAYVNAVAFLHED
jgi:tRNA A-37 threonylcarbamoyl transferase component Bud32